MTKPLVGVVMGSKSDWKGKMEHCFRILEGAKVPYVHAVLSAHRAPGELQQQIKEWDAAGVEVYIAAAGMAAALPGAVAGLTFQPVIGVPLSGSLMGMDAMLAISQMPTGVNVFPTAIDGTKSAAYGAIQLLGLAYPEWKKWYEDFRRTQTKECVENKNCLAEEILKLS